MAPTDLYQQLTFHAHVWGYGSLTQEERKFVLGYRKDHGITQEKTPLKPVRKWTDVYYSRRKKATRKPRNGKVTVDRRLATWNPPGIDTSLKTEDSFSENYLRLLHA